jgi:hypothetical protein
MNARPANRRPHSLWRGIAVCVIVVPLLALVGCGGRTSKAPGAAVGVLAGTASAPLDGDNDVDRFGQDRYDTDNDANPTYGPAPSAAQRGVIVTFIKHYYAIAAAGEGAKACTLLDPLIAEAVVEEHGARTGPPSLRGNTCAQVASKVFAQHHSELDEDVGTLRVDWVQLQANQAVALVRFGATRERLVRLRRTHGVWKMNALLDNGPL